MYTLEFLVKVLSCDWTILFVKEEFSKQLQLKVDHLFYPCYE